jgi:gamma-glutamyltranspeptidase/glutathione hydrolase
MKKTVSRRGAENAEKGKAFVFLSALFASLRETLFLFLVLVGPARAADTPPGYAVATPHPLATAAGVEILEDGGNAFDAAVAVSAAMTVVSSQSTGIGGGGFFLLHRQSDGLQVFVDGREVAPLAATAAMFQDARGVAIRKASLQGPRAAAIPGLPAAWQHLAGRYGSKPLARLLAPAIRIARNGYAIDAPKARMLADDNGHLSPAARAVWLPGGKPPAAGTVIRQPDLAATLERVARAGRAGFYEGEFARTLVDAVRAGGGLWQLEDLRRYRVVERKPMQAFFRGYRLTLAPPQSAAGVTLAQALTMLEARAWPPPDPAQATHELAEAMRRAYRDRRLLGDPDFVSMPLHRLLSREYLLPLARGIRAGAATPSESLAAAGEGGNNTAHFSILDAAGNRVAATETVNTEFGSGFMPPGTGVLLNNEMDDFAASLTASNAYGLVGSAANRIAPVKRPLSSMAPTFVEGPRGLLIVGSKGGSRIISQVLTGVLGFVQGQGARDLVAAPRIHHQHLPDRIDFEPGALTPEVQAGLRARGHTLREVPGGWGLMQAVWWDKANDRLAAAADPRGVGTGAVQRTRAAAPEAQVGR